MVRGQRGRANQVAAPSAEPLNIAYSLLRGNRELAAENRVFRVISACLPNLVTGSPVFTFILANRASDCIAAFPIADSAEGGYHDEF